MAGATAPHLAGLVVLDLSSVGPAARASRILADYGAEVIKVAPTSAKLARVLAVDQVALAVGQLQTGLAFCGKSVLSSQDDEAVRAQLGKLKTFLESLQSFNSVGRLKNFPHDAQADCPTLRQVACDTWGPFVFVRLSERGPTLRQHLEPVASELVEVLSSL